MRRKISLASAIILFSLAMILVVIAIISYNFVPCNGEIMNPGDRCIHYNSFGIETGRYTIDQERPYPTIIKEALGAFLFFAVGIVCAFKVPREKKPPKPKHPINSPEPGPHPPNQ